MIFSQRLLSIKPSATLAVGAHAARLKAQGVDIINLGLGEPDFPTPTHIQDAAISAIRNNRSYYTPVDGTASLKSAIIAKFKRDNNLDFKPEEIIVSTGAKQSIYNGCAALLNPGDEAIIPAPYWVSYPDMVELCDGKPVIIPTTTKQNYKMSAEQLEKTITKKTKLLILNSPSNPTGMVYRPQELRELADVLLKHPNVYVLTDDIYESLYWADESFCNILMVEPDLKNRTIVVNGVSKAYAMTGWRLGYAAAPTELTKLMTNLQSQTTSNPCSITQFAAEAALNGDQQCVEDMRVVYEKRQKLLLDGINAIPGFHCRPTQGAFYLFVDVSNAMTAFSQKDDVEFSQFLLNKAHIAVVPGSAFGTPGHIRLSYATNEKLLLSALERLHNI